MRATRRHRTVPMLLAALVTVAACSGPDGQPADRRVSAPPVSASASLAWRALAKAPSARTEVAAAASGTKIYVIGGYRADGGTVTTVEVFDTASGRWSVGPELPVAVNHAMATTVDGVVYVVGGHLPAGGQSAAAFRLAGGAWQRLDDLPQERAAGTAVAHDGRIYVAGGVRPGGIAEQMLIYDVVAEAWSVAPGPPTPREHLGGAGVGGRIYTVGGRVAGRGNLAAFEVYDPASQRWSKLPDLPTPRGGLAAAAACAGRIVAVGGEAQATFAEAEMFEVASGEWRSLPPLPTPRHGLGVVTVGATLYTLAGGPMPGLHVADTLEAIDLAALPGCR